MNNKDIIKNKIDEIEIFLMKWITIDINEVDYILNMQDELNTIRINIEYENSLDKIELKEQKAKDMIIMKEAIDENWKKKYTDKTAESELNIKYKNSDIAEAEVKYYIELLKWQIKRADDKINLWKKFLDFNK